MPTTVVKTIGTSARDYSTLQAWEDASPADLTAVDQIWQGQCYNDSQFSAALTVSGETTDATRYVELTTAAGQSFQDNASVRSNGLRYNQTNGVGLSVFSNYSNIITLSTTFTRVSKLQIVASGNGGLMSASSCTLKDLILENQGTGATLSVGNTTATFANVLIIINSNVNPAVFLIGTNYGGNVTMIGCGAVRPSNKTVGGTAVTVGNIANTHVIESCYSFGFTSSTSGGGFSTSKNNATDAATWGAGGTGNQTSVTYSDTTPFTQASTAQNPLDFRAIASTSLAANGFLDSTNAPNDISATARSATPTIGVWEIVTTATAPFPPFQMLTPGNIPSGQPGWLQM